LFIIKQITTQKDILAEGAAMRHCVASYASGCANGQWSIWSLGLLESGKYSRLITIQLNNNDCIVQARGLCNRMPTGEELVMIKQWCKTSNLFFERS
jgi:hypothetical protein